MSAGDARPCRRCESWSLADFARTRGNLPATLAEHEAVLAEVAQCTCGRHVENRSEFDAWFSNELLGRVLDAETAMVLGELPRDLPSRDDDIRGERRDADHP